MELTNSINLIFIFAVNIFFFFSGICLNSLVIFSFWRSVQLRKKLCYFMIMVLSCCDLFALLINSPLHVLIATWWLIGKLDVNARWAYISLNSTTSFLAFSLLALLVMNFDRYLATSYPFFHRTSVTKGRLLTLLAILIIVICQLQTVSSRQEKSQKQNNCTPNEKVIFFEKHIELLASSRLCCGAIHSNGRLLWTNDKLARDNIYVG